MPQLNIAIDNDLKQILDEKSQETGLHSTDLVRQILRSYLPISNDASIEYEGNTFQGKVKLITIKDPCKFWCGTFTTYNSGLSVLFDKGFFLTINNRSKYALAHGCHSSAEIINSERAIKMVISFYGIGDFYVDDKKKEDAVYLGGSSCKS